MKVVEVLGAHLGVTYLVKSITQSKIINEEKYHIEFSDNIPDMEVMVLFGKLNHEYIAEYIENGLAIQLQYDLGLK